MYIQTNTTQSPCLAIHKEPLSTNNFHLHFAKRARFMNPKSLIPSPPSFSGLHVCSHFTQQILFFDSTSPHKNFLSIHIVILVLLSLFIMLIKKCYINYCLPHQLPFVKSYYFCNKKVSLRNKKRWFLILRESNSK